MISEKQYMPTDKPHLYGFSKSSYGWCVQWLDDEFICALAKTPKEAYDRFLAKKEDKRLALLSNMGSKDGQEQPAASGKQGAANAR